MKKIENLVKNCEGHVEYEFIPDENVISVRIFEYDEMAEYSDDFEYYNYSLLTDELLDKIKTQCKEFAENIKCYVPNKFDKMGYGYFNYLEILITPIN